MGVESRRSVGAVAIVSTWDDLTRKSAITGALKLSTSFRFSRRERSPLNPFEYLSLMTSIVLALGITRTLTGLGEMLTRRNMLRLYWVHAVWGVNVFIWLLLNWWILFRWHTQTTWTFFLFVFVLLSPIIAFLLTVILIPEPIEEGMDLKRHYFANRRSFFAVASLLPPTDATDTLLKGWTHFQDQGIIYPVSLLIWFILVVGAVVTDDERYHAAFSIFFLLSLLVFIGVNLNLIG